MKFCLPYKGQFRYKDSKCTELLVGRSGGIYSHRYLKQITSPPNRRLFYFIDTKKVIIYFHGKNYFKLCLYRVFERHTY